MLTSLLIFVVSNVVRGDTNGNLQTATFTLIIMINNKLT